MDVAAISWVKLMTIYLKFKLFKKAPEILSYTYTYLRIVRYKGQ